MVAPNRIVWAEGTPRPYCLPAATASTGPSWLGLPMITEREATEERTATGRGQQHQGQRLGHGATG